MMMTIHTLHVFMIVRTGDAEQNSIQILVLKLWFPTASDEDPSALTSEKKTWDLSRLCSTDLQIWRVDTRL